jgi:hypothetical protein
MPLLKAIHNGCKFFIMNLVINLHRKKITRTKVDRIKKIISPSCEKMTLILKSKVVVSNKNGLEGFTWIKSGVVVKEAFKYSKALSASIP